MLEFRDFIICLIAVILAMAAFGSGHPVASGIICVIGTALTIHK